MVHQTPPLLFPQRCSDRVPFIADLKPSGKYVMEDLHAVGGTPAVMKYLLDKGFIDGSCLVSLLSKVKKTDTSPATCLSLPQRSQSLSACPPPPPQTVTGKTVAENLRDVAGLKAGQDVILPIEKPIKPSGHLQILYGNLSPVRACVRACVLRWCLSRPFNSATTTYPPCTSPD
jgi:dihydroxy-acid dehydratase